MQFMQYKIAACAWQILPRADLGGGGQGVGSPPFPKWPPPPFLKK